MQGKAWVFLLGCLLMSMPALAETSYDNGRDQQKIYHLFSNMDLVPTVKIRYAKPRVIAKLLYPKLEGDEANENIVTFNETVMDYLQEEYKKFRAQVAGNQAQQTSMASNEIKNDLNIDFDSSVINANNSPIISVRFSVHGYISGRGKSFHYHRVLNYDLKNGDEIELDDLFLPDSNYLQVIAQYSSDTLSKRLRDKSWIIQGTAAKAENYRNWNLNPYGLLITFDSEQVAPAVFGTQTILIPYTFLQGILEPDSPAGACLNYRKKCLRNNTLTGGFMDTALKLNHSRLNPLLRQA